MRTGACVLLRTSVLRLKVSVRTVYVFLRPTAHFVVNVSLATSLPVSPPSVKVTAPRSAAYQTETNKYHSLIHYALAKYQ